MIVETFGDLLQGHQSAEIRCLYTQAVVRRLSRGPGVIVLDPLAGPVLTVAEDTPIQYQPWFMDRGSLLFTHQEMPGQSLKLCGEGDHIEFEDGTIDTVLPSN